MADDDGTDSDEDFSATTPTRLRGVLHPLHDQLSRSLDGALRRAYSTPTIHPVLRSPPVSAAAAANNCAHSGSSSNNNNTEERLALSEARIEQLERELASVSDTLGMVVMALRVGTPLSLMEAAAADDSDTAAAAAIDGAAMSSSDEDFGDGAAADNDDDAAVVRPWYETVRRQQQQQQEFTT